MQTVIKAQSHEAIPVLSLAGSDCSGGAGIQADLKTFQAHCVYGMTVILSVVAENTMGVISSYDMPAWLVRDQIKAIFEDIPPVALKIGMLGSSEIIDCVASALHLYKPKLVVVDPVMFAKSGFALMPESARLDFAQKILPLASVLTPNIPEAEALCGFKIDGLDSMKAAALAIHERGAAAVLLKGGHGGGATSADMFFDGKEAFILEAPRVDTKNTHGTGCTLSAALTANLARGLGGLEAARRAKDFVFQAILHSLNLGRGCGPTNHSYRFCWG